MGRLSFVIKGETVDQIVLLNNRANVISAQDERNLLSSRYFEVKIPMDIETLQFWPHSFKIVEVF